MLKKVCACANGSAHSQDAQVRNDMRKTFDLIRTRDPREFLKLDQMKSEIDSTRTADVVSQMREIVGWVFKNHDPGEDYLKLTDGDHANEVADLSVQLWTKAHPDEPVPETLQISALLHDIERCESRYRVRELKLNYLGEECRKQLDEEYRKQVFHPHASWRLASVLIENLALNEGARESIEFLILHHEQSVFKQITINDLTMMHDPTQKPLYKSLRQQLDILRWADGLAFFKTTIFKFIVRELDKQPGVSVDKIARRVLNNYDRLTTDELKHAAIELIKENLPIFEQGAVNKGQLESVRTVLKLAKLVDS